MIQRYFIEIAYKGTHYHGWQTQPNAITVQEILNQSLFKVFRKSIETLGCGRTDTGVHASQFYAHFDLDINDNYDLPNIVKSLNGILPNDIAVLNIFKVQPDAHARFDATNRTYHYHLHFHKNPFKDETSWLIRKSLNFEAMNEACSILLEYDDFSAFCKANSDNFTNICNLTYCKWIKNEDGLMLIITANRFLRNMVRAIVGTVVEVGYEKMKPSAIREIIESKNRSEAGSSVPACGLFLTKVIYPYING